MDSPNFPYAQLPPPATPQLTESATLSAHFVKCTKLTPLGKNGLAQLPLPATPQTNGFGHTQRTIRKIH